MRRPIRVFVFLCVTAFSTAVCLSVVQASIDLPPEMMADKHLIKAEQLHAKEDYAGALEVMDKIIALQKDDEFKLPAGFHFKYARAALSAGSVKIALKSIDKYLSETGREGEFYRDALALLLEVEETQISAEELCTGKPEGAVCWKELANHPQCYIWDGYYYEDQTVTWSGKRFGSLAHGDGTLIWTRGDERHSETGRLARGKKEGRWVERMRGASGEGPYVDGVPHGHWVIRWDRGEKEKRSWVAGKKEGRWLSFNPHRPRGETCKSAIFRDGDQVTEWNNVSDSMCDF